MYCRLLVCLTLIFGSVLSHAQQLLTDKLTINDTARNTLVYLPDGYSKSKSYPLVIYLHGLGQAGTNINKLYETGLPKLLRAGFRPSFDFIMVAVQSPSYSVPPQWLEPLLQQAQQQWKVDSNRVYLTGIDAGGWSGYGSQLNISAAFAKKIAAIVTISAATQHADLKNLDWWQASRTPLWSVVGAADKRYTSQNTLMVQSVNKGTPGLGVLTVLPGVGHSGWNDVYNGTITTDGKTIWDWLYQFDRSKTFSKLHITGTLEADAGAATLSTTALASGGIHVEAEDFTEMYGVRTQTTADAGGGENVGWIEERDWMKYNISVATAGTYTLKMRLASDESGARFQVKNSSGTVLATVEVPNTTDWQLWQDVTATVNLPAGVQTIQFYSVAPEGWNINWFELSQANMMASTMAVGTWAYSGTHIEAEDFTDRSGILTQLTRDFAGGDRNLFDVQQGDWVSYQLNAPAAGSYTLCFRVACDATGSQFQIKNGSGTVLTTVPVPNTNGWQTWRDVTAVVRLAAGMQTLKLQSSSATGWNLNYFEVVKTPLNAFASYTLRINSGTSIYLRNGLNLDHIKGGDTLYIMGGAYNVIDLGNFRGTATNPIIIRNKSGRVTSKIIRLSNRPEYFKLLGNGDPSVTYGFKIDGMHTTGSCLTAFGTDFEIAYIEATQSKSGFFIKKNPVADDPLTQFPNYEMRNVYLHHNYLHHITGEGMYIGHTAADGGQNGNPLLPVRMRYVEIAYNRVDQTGWDGIQLANATTGNKIHHNTVTNFGTSNIYGQQAGILLGGNSQADIYDNTVKFGTGNGIQNFGFGLNKIYNNTLEKVGRNGTERGYEVVYCNDIIIKSETRPKQQIEAYNNTIKYPMPWGAVRVSGYNQNSLPATMKYNKVLLANAPADWEKRYFPTYVLNSIVKDNVLVQ